MASGLSPFTQDGVLGGGGQSYSVGGGGTQEKQVFVNKHRSVCFLTTGLAHWPLNVSPGSAPILSSLCSSPGNGCWAICSPC